MGTFEKLGILVIVVIIVMILAVAIYQWGGTGTEPAIGSVEVPDALSVIDLDEYDDEPGTARRPATGSERGAPVDDAFWADGTPKRHIIEKNDKLWVLVVKRWKLKDSFIAAIAAKNPGMDVKRLQLGDVLEIPDTASYVRRKKAAGTTARKGVRLYEIQIGDNLESIARAHLGSRSEWPAILELNPGLNPRRMLEGQEIRLPLR